MINQTGNTPASWLKLRAEAQQQVDDLMSTVDPDTKDLITSFCALFSGSVPPEELPQFYEYAAKGTVEQFHKLGEFLRLDAIYRAANNGYEEAVAARN